MAATSSSSDAPPLAKYLASTDKKTRDKATKQLTSFLSDSSQETLPRPEMSKLWKGIFYCFWMSDKPLVQQALASELADILLNISSTPMAFDFLQGFWEATVREWSGIDRLRIDKYYMLIRRFVNASFRLLLRMHWEPSYCDQYNAILTERGGPLCSDDTRVPTSLAYHLADIYLEELDKVLEDLPEPSPPPAPLSMLLNPFFALAARAPTKITYERIQSALMEPLFTALSPEPDDEPPSRKRPRLITPTYSSLIANACSSDPESEGAVESGKLRKVLLRRMFEVASEEDTRDANRRKMYNLWKRYSEDEESDSPTAVDAS
ncbi:Nop52-domain-containing protein [Daedalea quercina L-15889]|uniref:Nop52-domain-containing protein n=1 Tax=Daedalea quercina L-15889 TaxID=1314783 RepID=A0A165UI55_9APHY|nr:Nop52-domain-containing protein [Daedalea quercina L-15889]